MTRFPRLHEFLTADEDEAPIDKFSGRTRVAIIALGIIIPWTVIILIAVHLS